MNHYEPYLPVRGEDYTIYASAFFGGGADLFFHPPLGASETANDIDGNVVNFFKVLQTPALFEEFRKLCELTPYSEEVFEASKALLRVFGYFGESVNRAYHFFIVNRLSRGGSGESFNTRTKRLRRQFSEQVSSYLSSIENLQTFAERLKYVEFRKMCFKDFIPMYDSPETFHFLDPTYLPETRVAGTYANEMTPEDHVDLLRILATCEGKFMLCGYPSKMYEDAAELHGWKSKTFKVKKSSSSAETKPVADETIWMNYEN